MQLKTVFVALGLLVTTAAQADQGTYLGQVASAADCQTLAESKGFPLSNISSQVVWNGSNYVTVTYCYGFTSSVSKYLVKVDPAIGPAACLQEIGWEVGDLKCRILGADLDCRLTSGQSIAIKQAECVKAVYLKTYK